MLWLRTNQQIVNSLVLQRGIRTFAVTDDDEVRGLLTVSDIEKVPGPERIRYVADAFRAGMSVSDVFGVSKIDPWFLVQIEELIALEAEVRQQGIGGLDRERVRALKRKGFSDARIAALLKVREQAVRRRRHELGIRPVFKRVRLVTGFLYIPVGKGTRIDNNRAARCQVA